MHQILEPVGHLKKILLWVSYDSSSTRTSAVPHTVILLEFCFVV